MGLIIKNLNYLIDGTRILNDVSVQVEDGEKLIRWCEANGHDECIRYKEPEISKNAVSALIKGGIDVPYASIQESRSLGVK